jgi:hypothetical protein
VTVKIKLKIGGINDAKVIRLKLLVAIKKLNIIYKATKLKESRSENCITPFRLTDCWH